MGENVYPFRGRFGIGCFCATLRGRYNGLRTYKVICGSIFGDRVCIGHGVTLEDPSFLTFVLSWVMLTEQFLFHHRKHRIWRRLLLLCCFHHQELDLKCHLEGGNIL